METVVLIVEEVDAIPHSGASEEINVAILCEIADIVDNISVGLKVVQQLIKNKRKWW